MTAIQGSLRVHFANQEEKLEANIIKCNDALSDAMETEIRNKNSIIEQAFKFKSLNNRFEEIND